MHNIRLCLLLASLVLICANSTAQEHEHHHMHDAPKAAAAEKKGEDGRVLVVFPERLRQHTLSSMRDHLLTLAEIQEALSRGWYEKAGELAENRLGMSSLDAHGAHESGKYMPKGMQDIGLSLHRAASQFATEAQNASATGEIKPVLSALGRVTQACVACHATYRLQ